MYVPLDNVDYSRKTAAETEPGSPLSDPLIRDLYELSKYHPMWKDPQRVKEFRDSLYDMMSGKSRSTSPLENARVRQESPNGDGEFLEEGGPQKWNASRKL